MEFQLSPHKCHKTYRILRVTACCGNKTLLKSRCRERKHAHAVCAAPRPRHSRYDELAHAQLRKDNMLTHFTVFIYINEIII